MIYQANTLHVKEVQSGIVEICFNSSNSVNKLDLATLESLLSSVPISLNF